MAGFKLPQITPGKERQHRVLFGVTFTAVLPSGEVDSIAATGAVAERAVDALSWAAQYVGKSVVEYMQDEHAKGSLYHDDTDGVIITAASVDSGDCIWSVFTEQWVWEETIDQFGSVAIKSDLIKRYLQED